jgi:hypothetical protein
MRPWAQTPVPWEKNKLISRKRYLRQSHIWLYLTWSSCHRKLTFIISKNFIGVIIQMFMCFIFTFHCSLLMYRKVIDFFVGLDFWRYESLNSGSCVLVVGRQVLCHWKHKLSPGLFVCLFVCLFFSRVLLCSPSWLLTNFVASATLKNSKSYYFHFSSARKQACVPPCLV